MNNLFENKPLPKTSAHTSKEVAKQRLKSILMRDRVDISNDVIQLVREDIITVASDYFVISEKTSEIYLANMKRPHSEIDETMLVCMIPVSGIRASSS